MRIFYTFIFSIAFFLISFSGKSQGCSDAGLCSFGSMSILSDRYVNIPLDKTKLTKVNVVDSTGLDFSTHHDTISNVAQNNIQSVKKDSTSGASLMSCELSEYYGIGEQHTSIFITQLEGNFKLIDKKLYGQLKLPYTIVNGNLGTTNGLSDVTMSLSYFALNKSKCNLSFALGVKIPTNQSNLSMNDRPLPMVYQTSLGSTDILIGSRFTYRKWDFSVGYQHSFNANANQYVHLSNISDSVTYNGYFQSKNLRRHDDALFRINRKYEIKKVVLSSGLLFIYHTSNDDITNVFDERIQGVGSQGVTINLDLAGSIPLSKHVDFTFVLAKPLVQRKYVDDGLARSFVAIVGLKRNF